MDTAYLFFWRRALETTFNYGAQISYAPDGAVSFEAPMMPPGKTIHAWGTTKDFEHSLQLAELPSLIPGEDYALFIDWDVKEDSVFSQIVFLNDAGLEVGSEVFENGKGTFTFPIDASEYEIRLKNMRHQQLVFRYGMIIPESVHKNNDIALFLSQGLLVAKPKNRPVKGQVLGISERSSLTKPLWLPKSDELKFILFASTQQLTNPQWCHATASFLWTKFDSAVGPLKVAYQVGQHLAILRRELRATFR